MIPEGHLELISLKKNENVITSHGDKKKWKQTNTSTQIN